MTRANMFQTSADPRDRSKRLTLRRLLDANEEIWVRNASGSVFKDKVCNVVFQVGKEPAIDVVVIPPGNDPVCLTDRVDPESLRTCMDLFKLVNRGVLEILDPTYADEYYKTNQERKKVVEEKIDNLVNKRVDNSQPLPKLANAPTKTAVKLNPQINDICLKARHSAITEREALERVMELSSVLGDDDLNYLSTNGVYNGLKRWARERLEESVANTMKEEEEFVQAAKETKKRRAKKAVPKDPIEEAVE